MEMAAANPKKFRIFFWERVGGILALLVKLNKMVCI